MISNFLSGLQKFLRKTNINSGYKIYVQLEDKKQLKVESEVRLNKKVVGKVIEIIDNPDAYIVGLIIKDKTAIPLLSNFRIRMAKNHTYFIEILPSDDTRIIRANEYVSA